MLKAKRVRPQDDVDFERCVPVLEGSGRAWLARAPMTAHPGHRWLERLG